MGGLIKVGPENQLVPRPFQEIAKDVYNLEPRNDDVWVISFPRSGMAILHKMIRK